MRTGKRIAIVMGLTAAAVAAECGFASAQRFHEAFRKGEGVSPGAFRKDRRSQR